jgi:hypothetical protein
MGPYSFPRPRADVVIPGYVHDQLEGACSAGVADVDCSDEHLLA